MADQRESLLGPYPYRNNRWRIRLVIREPGSGQRSRKVDRYFDSAAEALAFRDAAQRALTAHQAAEGRTVGEALDEFLVFLEKEGTQPGTRYQYRRAVTRFCPPELPLRQLRQAMVQRAYTELAEVTAVATHRNSLGQLKTFLAFCVRRRWLASSPAAQVVGIGKRRRGKVQLSLRNSRRWYEVALALAEGGDEGALAALLTLVLGLRACEVSQSRVDALDDVERRGDTWRVHRSKTPKGLRSLEIPDAPPPIDGRPARKGLRELLLALADGRPDHEPLFRAVGGGFHDRTWVRKQVHRVCDLAGVPRVSAQAMRGAHATIALDRGLAPVYVADSLGHEDVRTTRESYAKPGAGGNAVRREVFRILQGGQGGRG